MRILLVCDGLDGTYGWSRYTKNLLEELVRKGHTVVTCTPSGQGGDIATLPKPLQMMTRPFVLFSVWKTIERAAHNHQIDIIHFTVEPYALVVSLLSKRLKKISVLTIHGNYGIRPLRWWASKWLARRMLQCLPKCIAVSTYTRDAVAKEVRNK